MMTNMVPVSLMVSLEVVKYIQANFMEQDVTIYDTDLAEPMKA